MGMIRNVTEGIHPYQQALLDKVSGGFKAGQMMIISAGRGGGKSYLNQLYGNNLCKEIMINIPGYPKTSASINRLMPKYKFSRANWYVAEFNWVHTGEVLEWCKQQFGPHPRRPDAWSRWVNKYGDKIHFSNEKDYQWFLLRWGV